MYQKKKNSTEKPPVIRNHKDTLFRMIFSDRNALLNLYNAMNESSYTNPEELEINTLENAVYMNMKNDISFLFDFSVNLYEQQSTWNPNMPLRNLFYIARLYEKILYDRQIYTNKMVKVPNPRFVVLYNGTEDLPERSILKLSDAYEKAESNVSLELNVILININIGKNQALLERCRELKEYMIYEEKVRNYSKEKPLPEAVEQAVTESIEEGILSDFLKKHRAEAIQMSIYEYDQEEHMKTIAEEAREEGIAEGIEQGIEQGNSRVKKLICLMVKDSRVEEIERMATDNEFQESLFQEYGI